MLLYYIYKSTFYPILSEGINNPKKLIFGFIRLLVGVYGSLNEMMCLFHLVVRLMILLLGLMMIINGVQLLNSLVPTPASVVLNVIFILLLLVYLMGMSPYDGTAYVVAGEPVVVR